MKFRIHFERKDGTEDSFDMSGDTLEQVLDEANKELSKRNGQHLTVVVREIKTPPDIVAWRAWLDSDEGKQCTYGDVQGHYLENRLRKAFMAGRKGRGA